LTDSIPALPALDAASSEPSSLVDCVAALNRGATTSTELLERALARIDGTQSTLNAFRVVCGESAREAATEADRRRRSGERLPLLGVPVAVKDDVDLAGESTAFGCAGAFAAKTQDSEVVRRLRDAGAVIVGKTNTPEVGIYPFTETSTFGATRNPWHLEYTPGGSSGGGAAAVAAGIVHAAVGSDGAGSVRIPAAWCGLVGVKPQRGRISTWPDAEAFNGLTCLGPLTRTVADAALMLDVLSGSHAGDLHTPPPPAESFTAAAARDPGRFRIAISLRAPFSGTRVRLDPEVRSGTQRIGRALRELGHEVIEADPRYGLIGLTLIARGQAGIADWVSRVPDRSLLDERTRGAARVGALFARTVLPLARAAEPLLARRVGAIFEDADIVITPTSATAPLRIGAAEGLSTWATEQLIASSCPYAWPWNVLGWPAVNVPAGVNRYGLPYGVQLLGSANTEGRLLALAAQLEQVERWHERIAPHAVKMAEQQ
jgi:amidase